MSTHCNIPTFTANARSCVELAKAIATAENCCAVSGFHFVRAALHLHPEEASDSLGIADTSAFVQAAGPPPQPWTGLRMHASEAFSPILKQLARTGQVVSIADLLRSIVRRPCIRVSQLLTSIGAQPKPAQPRPSAAPYLATQEHLQAVHRLWRLRAAACESTNFERDGNFSTSASSLWSAALALQETIESRSCPPARLLPVRGEGSPTREVLEGLIVHEFYGLGQFSQGLELRLLARFACAGPGWLRALDDVTRSVADLEGRDLVERSGHSVRPRPTDVVRLTEPLIADVLQALQADPFSSAERDMFALQLRHSPNSPAFPTEAPN